MSRWMSVVACLTCAVALSGVMGCSQPSNPAGGGPAASAGGGEVEDLRQLRTAYMDYLDANAQGPDSWETLLDFARQRELKTDGIERLRERGYQIKWSAKPSDATEGVGSFVVAASPSGGPKLMLDGSISE